MALSVLMRTVGQMAANCYLVFHTDTRECIIIDPGDDAEYIADTIQKNLLKPVYCILTHGHVDHVMAAASVQLFFNVPLLMHQKDRFLLAHTAESAKHYLRIRYTDPPPVVNGTVKEGDHIHIGTELLYCMHTPGHTPGSICLYASHADMLFAGDTIFENGSVGRSDWSYSRLADLHASIKRILSLPLHTTLYCGHGNPTTVQKEREFHPDLVY